MELYTPYVRANDMCLDDYMCVTFKCMCLCTQQSQGSNKNGIEYKEQANAHIRNKMKKIKQKKKHYEH